MAYRRRQGISRASTFKEDTIHRSPNDDDTTTSSSAAPSSSLAAQAIRASAAHRDSSLSSAYANSALHSSFKDRSKEGRTIVDKKTHDIIQETKKLQNRRRGTNDDNNQVSGIQSQSQEPRMQSTQQQTNQENQIKASRDVAIATAAKAKLLLRELKTLKADLAFAKERSSQLEEENKMLREALEKGDNPEDDDMIRLQLESLLAEKARLANENSVYARENRFLREIVEYHQLTMQDVVYLDDGIEEVTEVRRGISRILPVSPPLPSSPRAPLKRTTSEPP